MSVKTREGREKPWNWLTGEVLPAGGPSTRAVIVGNLLHEDSVMRRLKDGITSGSFDGEFRCYPLLDEKGHSLWRGKYPTTADVEAERRKIMDERAWQREYLLRILPDDHQVVQREWIQYYDELPDVSTFQIVSVLIGTDLAISESQTADYTTMIPALVTGTGSDLKIYILRGIVNERMDFPTSVRRGMNMFASSQALAPTTLLVEKVAYQASFEHQLKSEGIKAKGVVVSGDKRSRLAMTANLIQCGKVLFPRKGADQLIEQIVNFGIEKHDDLADAFSLLVNEAVVSSSRRRGWISSGRVDLV